MSLPFTLRNAGPEDEAFVFSAWIRTQRWYRPRYRDERSKAYQAMSPGIGVWHDQLHARIERLMPHVKIADAAGPLVGFICLEPGVLHYVYTEGRFRRKGVAREMLRAMFGTSRFEGRYTHWTHDAHYVLGEASSFDETPLERR